MMLNVNYNNNRKVYFMECIRAKILGKHNETLCLIRLSFSMKYEGNTCG